MKQKFRLLLLAVASLSVCACSSTQYGRTNYASPSSAPIRQSVQKGQENVGVARKHITTAQTQTKSLHDKLDRIAKQTEKSAKGDTVTPELHDLAIQGLQDADSLTKELADTQLALAQADTDLSTAQSQITTYQSQVDKLTKDLNDANGERNKAIDAKKAADAHVHKLKFWICSVAAALALLLVTRFAGALAPLLGPYAILLYVAAPALVFGFLWWRL